MTPDSPREIARRIINHSFMRVVTVDERALARALVEIDGVLMLTPCRCTHRGTASGSLLPDGSLNATSMTYTSRCAGCEIRSILDGGATAEGDDGMTDVKKVLYIDASSSRCGVCGLGADPNAKTHETIVEYGPRNGQPGCGAEWTHVSSHYTDFHGLYDRIRAMRPDLTEDFMTPFEALPLSGAEGTEPTSAEPGSPLR